MPSTSGLRVPCPSAQTSVGARARVPCTQARASARVSPSETHAGKPRFSEPPLRSRSTGDFTYPETRFRRSAPALVRPGIHRIGVRAWGAASDLAGGDDDPLEDPRRIKIEDGKNLMFIPQHDFCFTLPWGLFVALCGLAGFVIAGSTKSLLIGGGFGTLLMILGALSLKKWKAGKGSGIETLVSMGITASLGAMMGKKYLAGASMVPSGVIAIGAACMVLFYVVNLIRGGNPPHVEVSGKEE